MKNLIMGAAKGYGWQELEPFVTSCKKYCPDADLVLFVDDISDFTRDKMIRGGATPEPIPEGYDDILIVNSRFKFYLDYLEAHGDNYAQIFITDTRDVIFQGDLFAPFKDYTNWLGYSTEFLTIGEDADCNYKWLVGRFGKAEADKLSDKQIICAGTVIGSTDAMKIFCSKMWELILQALEKDYDQGTMNYLVWNNLLPIENLIEFDVQSSEIFTNGLIEDNRICGDKILRGDGGVPAVVHQYDRHDNLVELVDRIYRDKNFCTDDKFNDVRSVIEKIKYLLAIGRGDEASLFLTKKFSAEKISYEAIFYLINFWEYILRGNLGTSGKNFQLTIQSVFAACENMPEEHFSGIYERLLLAMKNNYPVSAQFKEFFARHLLPVAQRNLDAGNAKACLNCINFIEALNSYKS